MSDVKRYNANVFFPGCLGPVSREVVLADDAEKLEAEAQALREQVKALRARVVVLPSVDNVMNIVMRYQWNEKKNVTGTTNWAANLGMKVVDEMKRLNGKSVSEGLLRRIIQHLEWNGTEDQDITVMDYIRRGDSMAEELRSLLGEGKGHE